MRTLALAVALLLCSSMVAPSLALAADDGAWLEKAAEAAISNGQYARAVTLLRGLGALRPKDSTPQYRLAEGYTLAGQDEDAIVEYKRFAARPDAAGASKSRAESEARRLEDAPAPFTETLFRPTPATNESKRLFEEGKK